MRREQHAGVHGVPESDQPLDGQLLPAERTIAPAFSVNVGDFDGDGTKTFFEPEFLCQPAGNSTLRWRRGLLMRGDGTGQFAAVPLARSQGSLHGEQRGAAAGDFDQDGRLIWS
jgi:hypothetical protein